MSLENNQRVIEFPLLRSFATMLVSEEWVENVVERNIERTRKLELPALLPVFNRPKEELNKIWYAGFVSRTLMSFIGNDPVAVEKINIDRLRTNTDLLLQRNELNLGDATYFYLEQKLTLFDFLPTFTQSIEEGMMLVKEIEAYYHEVELYAVKILTNVQNEQLKDTVNFATHLANSTPDIVYVFDLESKKYVYINKELTAFLGYEGQSFVHAENALSSDIFHPEDKPLLVERYTKYPNLADKEILEDVLRVKDAKGIYRYLSTRALVFKRSEEGKVIQVLGIAQDITKQKSAEKELEILNSQLEQHIEERTRDLKESEQRFRTLADNIPVLAWMADENGFIFWYNNTWYEYTGSSPEQMEGWGWQSVHDSNVLPQVMQKWQASIETGEKFEMVFPLKGKDGSFRPFLTRVLPVKNEDGKIVRWFGTNTDIYHERQREETLRMHSTVLENMNEGVCVTDENGIIIYTNGSEDEMFGYQRDELVGKHVSVQYAYQQEESLELVANVIEQLKLKGFSEGEWKNIKKDGTIFFSHSHISILKLENKNLFICVQRDITQELLNKTEMLERNAELEKINNDLDNFIYTASHDLKSPVSNIEGLVHAIKDSTHYENEEIKTLIDMMGESVERFKSTIVDLTDISKVQKTISEDIEAISLDKIMEDVRFSILTQIKQANAAIYTDFSEVSSIRFSQKNLRSVFYNLLSNAVKYQSPDRSPEIWVKAEKAEGFVKVTFKDNGLGIKKEGLNKLFMMFKRLHNHVEGTGVGLYIVKKIIENAGGRIEVESEEGVGTTFILFIKEN